VQAYLACAKKDSFSAGNCPGSLRTPKMNHFGQQDGGARPPVIISDNRENRSAFLLLEGLLQFPNQSISPTSGRLPTRIITVPETTEESVEARSTIDTVQEKGRIPSDDHDAMNKPFSWTVSIVLLAYRLDWATLKSIASSAILDL
jgi:hypothetical protein